MLRITSFAVVPASARVSRILAHRPRVVNTQWWCWLGFAFRTNPPVQMPFGTRFVGFSIAGPRVVRRNLVDPASSHMLVSKIKPCMSQNMLFLTNLQMAHYNSHSLIGCCFYMDTCGNSIANTCLQSQLHGRVVLISSRTRQKGGPQCG